MGRPGAHGKAAERTGPSDLFKAQKDHRGGCDVMWCCCTIYSTLLPLGKDQWDVGPNAVNNSTLGDNDGSITRSIFHQGAVEKKLGLTGATEQTQK